MIRSSVRPYPSDEEPLDGLTFQDLDGDGRMLSMRVVDPNGPWKTHPDDPRLLIQPARNPRTREHVYRILPEGPVRITTA